MTYMDPTYRDVSSLRPDDGPQPFVFLGSRRPVPLETRIEQDPRVPDGTVPVAVYRHGGGPRIGRFAADPASLDRLRSLFDRPRRVGFSCREEYPGLVGDLLVLVPTDTLEKLFGEEPPEEGEPWRGSLEPPPDLTGDPVEVEQTDDPAADTTGEGGGQFGALHLGTIVRFESDRNHAGDFVREAVDTFEATLRGDLPSLSGRLMHELAESASVDDGPDRRAGGSA